MNKLLQKLDRAAGRWVNTMDEHLQQPIADTLSGEVFLHEASANHNPQQSVQYVAMPATDPVRKPAPAAPSVARPTVLRKA